MLATLQFAGILGALSRWPRAAVLLAPLLRVLDTADLASLRHLGLPLNLMPLNRYRLGVQALLARGDGVAARDLLDRLGPWVQPLACLEVLRSELAATPPAP